jgi:glycogen debranching enzyme
LSKLEETLVIDGRRYELGTNPYPGVVHPQGFQYLKQFLLDPFPTFTFNADGNEIKKTLFIVQGENTTVIQYRFKSEAAKGQLEIRPLIAFSDYHSLTQENGLSPAGRICKRSRSALRCILVYPSFLRKQCGLDRAYKPLVISTMEPNWSAGSTPGKTCATPVCFASI